MNNHSDGVSEMPSATVEAAPLQLRAASSELLLVSCVLCAPPYELLAGPLIAMRAGSSSLTTSVVWVPSFAADLMVGGAMTADGGSQRASGDKDAGAMALKTCLMLQVSLCRCGVAAANTAA